jgi:non-lysosomal glucosylceramidase
LLDEGMMVIKSVRDRYDGEKRNPWNELECGSNYARSMASYALLNAFSGFEFDMVQKKLSFSPLNPENSFQCFWSLDSAWGEITVEGESATLNVHYGRLALNSLGLRFAKHIQAVILNHQHVGFVYQDGYIRFAKALLLEQGERLEVKLT